MHGLCYGGGPKLMAACGAGGAIMTGNKRVRRRVSGWYEIVWKIEADVKACGTTERALPLRLKFPHNY